MSDRDAGGLIPAAQEALAKAMHAAGIALTAAGIGLAALVVGMVAAMLAVVAIVSRVVGEMLSHLAELIRGMIDAAVAMVPELLRAAISVTALVCMWQAFNLAWAGYAQDMPAWLAAILAATMAIVPVAYGFYRHLWPWVLAASLAVVCAGWLLANTGTLVRVGAVLGTVGVLIWKDIMGRTNVRVGVDDN